MATDNDIKKEFGEAYKNAIGYWGDFITEAKKDLQMILGDQWDAKVVAYLNDQRRNALAFRKDHRIIKLIGGFQRKNRLALKTDPVEGSDETTANQFTALLLWIMQACNGYHVMSDAFELGPLMTGANLVEIALDYSSDPANGDIRLVRRPFNKFLLDPNFSTRDLSDCQYLLTRDYLVKDAVLSILPEEPRAAIKDIEPRGRDDKYPYFSPPQDIKGGELMCYDQMYLRTYEQSKILIDPRTNAQHVWKGNKERLDIFLADFPDIKVVERYVRTVEYRILVDGEVAYKGKEPLGIDDYPVIAQLGFFAPEYDQAKWKLQSAERVIRDSVTETNKRRSKMLDIIDSQIGSGRKVKVGALVNPSDAYKSGQGVVLWGKENTDLDRDIREIDPPQLPAGLFQLNELMDKDVMETLGANAELLGQPENEDIQVAGILSKLRQGSGLTILQDLFDNYRLAKKHLGNKLVKVVQKNWSGFKVARVINERPTKEFFDGNFGKYDCVPTEGVLSDTQRHMYYAQLIALKQMEAPIPWQEIIDASPIVGKKEIKEAIKQAEQHAAQDMQSQKVMEQLTQALMQSETAENIAAAGEKRAQAAENRGNMALDRIKTIRELAKLKDEQVINFLKFVLDLEKTGNEPQKTATGGQK